MITITFPDGRTQQYPPDITGMDVAKSISEGLARKVLSVEVNGEVWDSLRPIGQDATVRLLTWDDPGGKSTFWHSSAHLMAEAIEERFPGVRLAIGPPIEHGFYYDMDLGDSLISEKELEELEKRMKELARRDAPYTRRHVSKAEATEFYRQRDNPYKLELISELEDGDITFYTQGNFTDLCRGPHIPHTGYIKAAKLLSVAGAYWRGNEKNKQLTRIYGITFPKQSELDEYLAMLEEAKKRDHRKLGKELELFTFDDDVGPGLPLWLPRGTVIIEELERLAKETERKAGYDRVRTPHIARESMYLTSGHLPYYKDSMFPPMELEGSTYYLKAMNCPHHHKLFAALQRSYRELPLRFAEYGTCYRYEKSGELFGLMRVRTLQMNDAHLYMTKEQFPAEFQAVNEMYLLYFKLFGIEKYMMRFSTHDPAKLGQKYVNEPELWIETENMVRQVLQDSRVPYVEVADEAAFYGPKIDIQVWSAIGREFTLSTNQVDFAQPRRFNLQFINAEGAFETPICIHRAPLGTHERFIGFLIEHYAGNFPVWLAPEQVTVLPISERFMDYAREVHDNCRNADIRISIDTRSEKIGKKIRDAEIKKIPYMLIVGEKEVANRAVSVRRHLEGDLGSMSFGDFLKHIQPQLRPAI